MRFTLVVDKLTSNKKGGRMASSWFEIFLASGEAVSTSASAVDRMRNDLCHRIVSPRDNLRANA